ncbi:MAG: LamG-like jellyroll fold domain-containing protein [Anaerohalosphaeraceae bacterium]
MKKKWLMLAITVVLSLSTVSMAQLIVTTATGSGADGGISNDGNQGPNVVLNSGNTPIRRYEGTRAKAMIVRYDVRNVGGDLSGATLSFTTTSTANRGRTLNLWALTDDSLDNWNEATICYNTAPGVLHEGDTGYQLNYITMDTTKWTLMGTMPIAAAASLNTGAIDPNFVKNDKNGLLTLLLYTSTSDSSQSWYVANKEGSIPPPTLTFPNARCAINPIPAADSDVLASLTTLSWTDAEPNHPSGTITCDVYLGTSEPNMALSDYGLTQIADNTPLTSITIPEAMRPLTETMYYWIVDSYDSSSGIPYLGTGAIWRFNVTGVPLITTHPQPQTVAQGQTADFAVIVESYSEPHYTWYRSADNANNTLTDDTQVGTDSATLSLVTTRTDEGYYYCKVVNKSGETNAVYSNTALLVVHRQVAHWTLNAADFSNSLYQDISGEGHPADPNGASPVFDAGVIVGSEGVSMDAQGFASAGTWNPSNYSNAFTVSMWIKWNGSNSSYQNLLSKMDSWAADDMMWQFGISTENTVGIIRSGGSTIANGSPVVGEWEFIALTFNGTTATVYRVVDGNVYFLTTAGSFSLGTDTAATLWLGASAGGGQLFNGIMDDIQIFNYSKDPVAIADLYNQVLSRDFCVLAYGSAEFDLDVNNNCRIELGDFAALAANWMGCGLYPETACP